MIRLQPGELQSLFHTVLQINALYEKTSVSIVNNLHLELLTKELKQSLRLRNQTGFVRSITFRLQTNIPHY